MRSGNSKGFTLVELMVVISVIAILSGVTFRLMSAAALQRQRADTIAKLERLQNALSGFYAVHGSYPPVEFYRETDLNSTGMNASGENLSSKTAAQRANYVAGAQVFGFAYPFPKGMSSYIQDTIRGNESWTALGVLDPHAALGALNLSASKWEDNRTFCFGLMSYLLPRVELIGYMGMDGGNANVGIDNQFFNSELWRRGNSGTSGSSVTTTMGQGNLEKLLSKQRALENETCAKWLPNLGGIVSIASGLDGAIVLGERIDDGWWGEWLLVKSGNVYTVLSNATVKDGWGREFYYYSAPPHQSYRLWSAGPNGNTFPAWLPPSEYDNSGLGVNGDVIRRWVVDDVIGGATGGQ